MRIIRFIFLSLLALGLIGLTCLFIFFQTFDTDQYLPQITHKISVALGRPVSIGGVGLGISPWGITLDAGPLIVADDAAFTSQPFIKVDRVRISLDLRFLIFKREIHITNILLQSPQIHFIRSQEGNINVRSVGQAVGFVVKGPNINAVASPVSSFIARSETTKHRHGGAALPSDLREYTIKKQALFGGATVKCIRIQDGTISFIDQNQAMPQDVWLRDINASLNDFSLSKPFQLLFNASGLVFKSILPGDPDSPILKNITGVVQLNMANLEKGGSGDITGNGDVSVAGGVIRNFNIIKTVLSHALGNFGVNGDNIDNLLRGQLKSKLGAADTVIKKAEARFSLHDKTVFIDNFLIETDIFEFTAKGSVGQRLNTDMQTMLRLNEDTSAALVNEFAGLKFLCDDAKRIAVDASLKGVIPHLKYKLNKDFRKKSKKALIEEGVNILGALLGRS